jgi:hypothetical protein
VQVRAERLDRHAPPPCSHIYIYISSLFSSLDGHAPPPPPCTLSPSIPPSLPPSLRPSSLHTHTHVNKIPTHGACECRKGGREAVRVLTPAHSALTRAEGGKGGWVVLEGRVGSVGREGG